MKRIIWFRTVKNARAFSEPPALVTDLVPIKTNFFKFSSDFIFFRNEKRRLLWLRFLILRFWRGSRKKSSLEYTEEDFDLKERNHTSKLPFRPFTRKSRTFGICNRKEFCFPQTSFNFRWSKSQNFVKIDFSRNSKNVIIHFWDKSFAQKYFFSNFEPVFNHKKKFH